ncbi:MAG: hypothetical protein GX976_04560, partial [Bacteroidales bacterium]|nr:hypothetical protein [Bacteroidales bacterium]
MTSFRGSIILLFITLTSFSTKSAAQENRNFTLEELIPGGNDYFRFIPRISASYQWYGNRLMVTENDTVWEVINPTGRNSKKMWLTFDDLSSDSLFGEQKVIRLAFQEEERDAAILTTSNGVATFNPKKKKIETFFNFPEKSDNQTLSPSGRHLAFTESNNLYLLDSEGKVSTVT